MTPSLLSTCRKCNNNLAGNYCGHCGTPVTIKRVDGHYVLHEIQHVLHFEKGILYTIKGLLISPGKNVQSFILEDRSRLIKPILFIVLTSVLYTTIVHFFPVAAHETAHPAKVSMTTAVFEWIQAHYGYANIIMGLFIAAWTKLFFKKSNYNFFEVLIMLCFIMGMGMLFYACFALIAAVIKVNLDGVASLVAIGYCAWGMGQFFNKRSAASYAKAFVAYVLGMVSFFITAAGIGFLLDLVIPH